MSPTTAKLLSVLAIVGGLWTAALMLQTIDERYPLAVPAERMLYVRSGAVASRLMLTLRPVAADVYWIRAIQHYGRDMRSGRREGRFELLQPLLDLTTTLDPHFNIVYRFGAVFLATDPPAGPGRPDLAIALLEKGIRNNPDRWQYAQDAGFVYYFKAANDYDPELMTKDYHTAAEWFERAAAMPGAPTWLKPIAGITLAQGGDRGQAAKLLIELHEQTSEDYLKKAAERGLAQIQSLNDIDGLQAAVEKFFEDHHAYPKTWSELAPGKGSPVDPAGAPYQLDPDNHLVTIHPQSPLAPLPRIPAHR